MASPRLQHTKNTLYLGLFIHCKKLDELVYMHRTAVAVNRDGKIVAVERHCDRTKAEAVLLPRLGWDAREVEIVEADEEEEKFFFPGFVDTHIHAPQYPNSGLFGKTTLLSWLETYTFPMEASLASLPKARQVYTRCVQRTLSHGTTTASYYATIDVAATNLLADLCVRFGQRAFVGRVCMDALGPDYYLDEDAAVSESKTRECISHMAQLDPDRKLVTPIITPRFAPACSRESMKRLSKLQQEMDLPLQTHISENSAEIDLVHEMFPEEFKKETTRYAGVYDAFGLLTPKTVLAHAIHVNETETELIARRGAGVSHCPCSNSALGSGEARIRWLLEKGVKVGLGTDVSGGFSPSMLVAARLAVLVSRHHGMPGHGQEMQKTEDTGDKQKLTPAESLHLATRGGAEVLGLGNNIGGFEVGKQFDAQLVGLGPVVPDEVSEDGYNAKSGTGSESGPVDIFGWETWEEKVAKWVFNGDDRNTLKVWVRGHLVHHR